MLLLQGVTYAHPNKEILFSDIQLSINANDKVAVIGNNGTGKSTLLKIMAGESMPSAGTMKAIFKPYYVLQLFGQYNHYSIAQVLQIEGKLKALKAILSGDVTDNNLSQLNDDWAIEERCKAAFDYWDLSDLDLNQSMVTLSGGQKTRVLLAGIVIHEAEIVLLDEPSNHLDAAGRAMLYEYIKTTKHTLVVVSHDITLLNLLNKVYELSGDGIIMYGGNYDFYKTQKSIERDALQDDVKAKEKALRKAKETERAAMERQQKLDARGKKKQEKAGLPTISMNTFRNNAEKSTSRIKQIHAGKVDAIADELYVLRKALPVVDQMKMAFQHSDLHKGKILITANQINAGYGTEMLWREPLDLQILSGERIAIKGKNGSGKTTLVKIILGKMEPAIGNIIRNTGLTFGADLSANNAIYIDQNYTLINNKLTVNEQVKQFNSGALQEHEINIRLSRFLFTPEDWGKSCYMLSGGEKMRLILCCLTVSNKAPDMIVLDEPTNNLDIQNVEMLTAALNEYKGTLLVISHDEYFLKQIGVQRFIEVEV